MIGRGEQSLGFVLTDDLGDGIANFSDVRSRGCSTIHAKRRTPRVGHLACDGSLLSAVDLKAVVREASAQSVVRFERERHERLARAAANDIGPRTRSERKVERTEQHRLARSGFTGKDSCAVGELDVGAFDQPVALDLQLPQHRL